MSPPKTRSTLDTTVPSPAHFIECGESGSSSSRRANATIPSKLRRLNRSLKPNRSTDIQNYGSEEEIESEDEAFPFYSPLTTRSFLTSADDEDEDELSSYSTGVAPSTCLPRVTAEPVDISEETSQSRSPAEPELCLFDWKEFPKRPIPRPDRRELFTETEGPVLDLPGRTVPSPEAIFLAIWDDTIMDLIATETNRYAEEALSKTLGPQSRLRRWTPTNVNELYVYFGVLLAMGLCIKSNVKEYWQCDGSICDTPNFSKYLTYNRFVLLNKFLHFTKNDENISTLTPAEAKIHKIEPIADHLNQKFQMSYKLKQNICINDSLTQSKTASTDIKTYEVCDAKSGYLWRFQIHSGSKTSSGEQPAHLSRTIDNLVLSLLQGLENRGHCVWMDSYYNSPALARSLKTKGFDCAGTLCTNRQFVPQHLASLKKRNMTIGEVQGCTSGDVDILVWRDQNKVATISTFHGNAVKRVKDTVKPIVVLDYNLHMGGVDRKDQKLAMFPLERKGSRVWYKKLFKRLLNVSVLNSFILLSEFPESEQSFPRVTTHRGFRWELIKSLLKKKAQPPTDKISSDDGVSSFSEDYYRHLPKEYPALPGRGREKMRRVCSVCRKRTHVYCPGCNVTLCPFSCFSYYHAVK